MKSAGVPSGFDLHDLITRLVPGGVLAGFFILFSAGYDPVSNYVTHDLFLISFIIISYITGESVDHIRRITVPVPYRFQRLLFTETENTKMLGRLDRLYVRLNDYPILSTFLPEVSKPDTIMEDMGYNIIQELQKDIPQFTSLDDREIFLIFTRIVSDSISPSTKRYQSIYVFVVNMQVVFILAGFLAIIGLTFNLTADPLSPIMAIIAGPIVMFYLVFMFKKIDKEYIDNLFLDYLIHRDELDSEDRMISDIY